MVPIAQVKTLRSAVLDKALPLRNKALAVLAYLRGIDAAEIAAFLQVSERTVFRYWALFQRGGADALLNRRTRSDKKCLQEPVKNAVFAALHSPPSSHGVNRTTWKLADIQRVVREQTSKPVSRNVIARIIKDAGYQWRHARIVLTSNDPEYREKVDAIKRILSELKRDEAFFSIDEYGPFAIKKKGGLKRVAPGERYTVPQYQKSKGWMILTAALELSRNQVSYFYSRKKNTDEMIKMAELLRTPVPRV